MRFSDPQTEWRIADVERKLNNKLDKYETTETDHRVDRLESALREACSQITSLRAELEDIKNQLNQNI